MQFTKCRQPSKTTILQTCLRRASRIGGVMDQRYPPPLYGALVLPKHRRFLRIALTEQSLQPAALAIWTLVLVCLMIIRRMSVCCSVVRRGAMLIINGGSPAGDGACTNDPAAAQIVGRYHLRLSRIFHESSPNRMQAQKLSKGADGIT